AQGLSNRSLIHVRRRSFAAAESDLVAARGLYVDQGIEPPGHIEQNLGFLKAQQGDVPASLRLMDAAEERYRAQGEVEASLLLDRAGVLLSVRLLDEARAAAEAAVAAYVKQRRDIHVPDAQLVLSTIALLQGETATAISSAAHAVSGYRRLGHAQS